MDDELDARLRGFEVQQAKQGEQLTELIGLVRTLSASQAGGARGADAARPRMRLDIRPATLRDDGRLPPVGPVPATLPPVAPSSRPALLSDAEVQAEVDRVMEQMRAGRVPLPKIVS